MPILNGYDTCAKIRKNDAKESIRELLGFGGASLKRGTYIGPILDNNRDIHDDEDDVPKERLFIVALSGLITDSVIEKGKKCGFDEFSKIISPPPLIISIVEAPLTEAKVKEVIFTRVQNREMFE